MAATHTTSAIGEALRFLSMDSIFYCPSELTEPWGLELPAMDCLWFHVVTSGGATVCVDETEVIVEVGDLVLIPHGNGHQVWGATPAPTPSVFDLPHEYVGEHYGVLRHGGGGDRSDIVCGGVRFDHPSARHMLQSLPSIIHIEGALTSRSDWMRATLDLLAEETQTVRPGSEAVVSRLCDILVIQAIRTWIERDPAAQTGWLGALRDEQIGAAIAHIHREPAANWTVGSLAESVAMSRSAFAARFTELVGESAMRYVTRWRMYVALELLIKSTDSVAAVGVMVGYDSEAAFSRAFKRVMGTSPRAARVAQTPSR